jgi:hypothetical protein
MAVEEQTDFGFLMKLKMNNKVMLLSFNYCLRLWSICCLQRRKLLVKSEEENKNM